MRRTQRNRCAGFNLLRGCALLQKAHIVIDAGTLPARSRKRCKKPRSPLAGFSAARKAAAAAAIERPLSMAWIQYWSPVSGERCRDRGITRSRTRLRSLSFAYSGEFNNAKATCWAVPPLLRKFVKEVSVGESTARSVLHKTLRQPARGFGTAFDAQARPGRVACPWSSRPLQAARPLASAIRPSISR